METYGPLRVHLADEKSPREKCDWSAFVLEVKNSPKAEIETPSCQWRDSNNTIWLSIIDRGALVTCHFADGYRFQIDFSLREIALFGRFAWDEVSLRHLRNHILPILLQSSGELVLHASAVRLASPIKPAILFAGRSGVGKSTLAAFLSKRHSLLADDASLIYVGEAPPLVVATSSSVALWPRSEALLNIENPNATPERKRECIVRSAEQTSALSGIFFLGQESQHLQSQQLSGAELVQKLQSAVLTIRPYDAELNAAMFSKLTTLAKTVPCYELGYPPGVAGLEKVEELLHKIVG